MDRCFIYGENCEELVLTGGGVIDGNAPAFHNDLDAYSPRPMLVRLKDCKKVIIEHLSIFDAAAWEGEWVFSQAAETGGGRGICPTLDGGRS